MTGLPKIREEVLNCEEIRSIFLFQLFQTFGGPDSLDGSYLYANSHLKKIVDNIQTIFKLNREENPDKEKVNSLENEIFISLAELYNSPFDVPYYDNVIAEYIVIFYQDEEKNVIDNAHHHFNKKPSHFLGMGSRLRDLASNNDKSSGSSKTGPIRLKLFGNRLDKKYADFPTSERILAELFDLHASSEDCRVKNSIQSMIEEASQHYVHLRELSEERLQELSTNKDNSPE